MLENNSRLWKSWLLMISAGGCLPSARHVPSSVSSAAVIKQAASRPLEAHIWAVVCKNHPCCVGQVENGGHRAGGGGDGGGADKGESEPGRLLGLWSRHRGHGAGRVAHQVRAL